MTRLLISTNVTFVVERMSHVHVHVHVHTCECESTCICVVVQTRLNALACIDRLIDSLEKMMIIEDVLPFLIDITGQDVDIVMAIIGQCNVSLHRLLGLVIFNACSYTIWSPFSSSFPKQYVHGIQWNQRNFSICIAYIVFHFHLT